LKTVSDDGLFSLRPAGLRRGFTAAGQRRQRSGRRAKFLAVTGIVARLRFSGA
jgi:hypothetical protein